MKITLTIQRYNPETDSSPYMQRYELEAGPTDRVLDLLMEVKRTRDGTLAFRKSCAHGVCGSDAMVINGKERLACKTLVQDTVEGDAGEITVEPMKHLPIQRDLMVLQDTFFQKYRSISPFFVPAEEAPRSGEYNQSQQEREAFDDPTKCILCGACYSACPVLDERHDFIGPAACTQAARFVKDSRDAGLAPRLDALDADEGVWSCRNHFECTRVCPRGIKITKLINETKREIKKHHENT
jgi:succinate dehydrogenase / fumarate reductase, iron-sulfur subunit